MTVFLIKKRRREESGLGNSFMKIGKAKKSYLKEVSEMYEDEMKDKFEDVNEKPISSSDYFKILQRNFGKSEMFVLKDRDLIKGFIWWKKSNGEINLEEVFVKEKMKGHGKLLLDFLVGKARKSKVKKINLDVHFNNAQGIEFFRKAGFSERTIEMSLDVVNEKFK